MSDYKVFPKSIRINNLKCFNEEDVNLNVPDGTEGSGLTLLIGDNGSGKTTILEAINYAFSGRFAENRIDISDFTDPEKPIVVECLTEHFKVNSGSDFRKGHYFNSRGITFSAKSRDRKKAGAFLSSPIAANSKFEMDEDTYYLKKDDSCYIPSNPNSTQSIDQRDLSFDQSRINGNGTNVFFFDKSRSRQLSSGNFRTSFDRICEDLDWKFRKKLNSDGKVDEYIDFFSNDLFDYVLDNAQKGVGSKVASQLSDFFDDKQFLNLRIDLIDLLKPFSSAFFAVRGKGDLTQIKPNNLGSGVEFILAILFQKLLSEQSKGEKVYLIDEPEMHLHPKAQEQLSKILISESAKNQIVLSTHSPYMLKNLLSKCGATVLTKNSAGKIEVTNQSVQSVGLFPWSPTISEVNYKAFGLYTIEFHNELYGYLQEREECWRIHEMETFLSGKGISKNLTWIKMPSNKTEDLTICSYVRNSIHHPENTANEQVDDNLLKSSIDTLVKLI